MTKRRTERDLDELRGEVLEDLSPDDRLQLYLEAKAEDNETWMDRLIETCPQYRYRGTDFAFTERDRFSFKLCLHAMYGLHTAMLEFELVKKVQQLTRRIDFNRDEEPTDAELEQAEKRAENLRMLFGDLYTLYHSYRQFAEEILGVDLETWLGAHPNGQFVLEGVAETLDDSLQHKLAEEDLNPNAEAEDDDWVTLDDVADIRYEAHSRLWAKAVDGF
jgi:hypothetical protein